MKYIKTLLVEQFSISVSEVSISTSFGGRACNFRTEKGHEVTSLEDTATAAEQAAARLSIGNFASFGGIPAGVVGPSDLIGLSAINMPGVPIYPDRLVWEN